jgi:phytoene synthase
MSKIEKDIFKNGSTTYYWSSKFFPRSVRDDVFKLYSFVRVVDDIVDNVPADIARFNKIKKRWITVKKELKNKKVTKPLDDSVDERIIANIAYVVHRYDCDTTWVDAFLDSMQMDVDKKQYTKLEDTLEYIYGSAEVIGLFMARIMQLPIKPYEYARMQGRAMQWINFLRDIDEDNTLGRCYFPKSTLKKFGLNDLKQKTAQANPKAFKKFMTEQIGLYEQWQTEADKGFSYIPKRLRIPLQTATDMYNWTAKEIKKDPFIVYSIKVKPKKTKVLKTAAKNTIK